MRSVWLAVLLAAAPITVVSTRAAAEPTEIGGFFGPRIFSNDSALGYLPDASFHPSLTNSVGLGGRIAKAFGVPWFLPEFELMVVPTKTNMVGGASPATVVWIEPRFQLRIDLLPKRKVEPFIMVGGGSPISLSFATKTFNSGIIGEGYAGAGIRFNTHKGFVLRMDARFAMLPSATDLITFEGDVTLGLEFGAAGTSPKPQESQVVVSGPPPDKDEDGIADDVDKCPDRPEDTDNFEDGDGCPEIDNDNDRVLDIADTCPGEAETINGYMDDDGCADSVPADVDGIRGTIEGLIYADGETVVRESAKKNMQKIAKVMTDHPSIKIVLVGYTDDREAKAFAEAPVQGQPPPDIATIATDLARARAEAVRQALVAAGVPAGRMVVDGLGAEDPVADNTSAKGRLANRRVELKLFVPK